MQDSAYRKLYRLDEGKMLFGVCAGLAEYFEVDATIIRIIVVLLSFGAGIGIVIYLVLAIIMPEKNKSTNNEESTYVHVKLIGNKFINVLTKVLSNCGLCRTIQGTRMWLGIFVISFGVILLLQNFDLLTWIRFDILWPIIIILIGFWLLSRRRR